ncbi:LysM peptidoglycan-binding domain-containing protein [Domibacillus sp. 8LH]|uniref:peptidoglycan endopeptidase n=1 Tax=Domibacillus sp. 8LH TaxID=3073900 RepID=UPI0031812284
MNKTVISLTAAAFIATGAASAAHASELYTVKKGDTLFSIANQYKLSVVQLMELNDLTSDALSINDQLIVSQTEENIQEEPNEVKTETAEPAAVVYTAAASSYTVQSGDSLGLIASRYKTSVSALKQLNGLSSDVIYAGQKLKVSGSASSTPASTSKPSTSTSTSTYTVQSGDSLGLIASRYKTSVSALKQLNALSTDVIYVGQKLKVSGSASSSTPAANTGTSKPSTSTSTYTVQSGDSLGLIASRFKTTVSALKQLNGLTTDVIYVGQKLKVSGSAPVTQSPPSPNQPSSSVSNGLYVVQRGDSLGAIASRYGMTVAALKQMNGLKSDVIFVGQKLKVAGSTGTGKTPTQVSNPASSGGYSVNTLISTAKSLMGIPYVWGGASTSGFDCSGFIYYVYKEAGKSIARTNTEGYYSRSYEVSSPAVGDLVFFSNTYKKGISHMGIYIGGGQFIHASSSSGITISSLSNSYFQPRFTAFKRFY